MKRFKNTGIAIATIGALAFAAAPNADAAPTPVQVEPGSVIVDKYGNETEVAEGQTDVVLQDGDTVKDASGKDITKEVAGTTGDLGNREATDTENRIRNGLGLEERDTLKDKNAIPTTLKKGDKVIDRNGNVVLTADTDGQEVVLRAGDRVDDANGQKVTRDRGGQVLTHEEKIAAGVLGGLATVFIAGVLYNVVTNAQGEKVLVPADRPDQNPTADDKAKTDELVNQHGDEIAAQANAQGGEGADASTGVAGTADSGAATGERGVGAATDNSSVAKSLIALLVLSVMGTAAFVFGRRRLV